MATPTTAPSGPPPPAKQAGTSGSIYLIRALASVMLILAFLLYYLLISDPDASTAIIGLILLIAGLGLGIVGVWIGNIKIFQRWERITLNLIFLAISVIIFIAGAVVSGSRIDTGSAIPISELVGVLLFGFFMLSYIEFSHASYRFTDIDDYSLSHELKGFNVGNVVNNYLMWYGILMGIILVISFLVLATHYGLLVAINSTNEVFGSSVELNSIYVFAMAVAIWFIPMGIFSSIIFGEGSLIKSTRTIFIRAERGPGEEMLGLQEVEHPSQMQQR
ncbi:MAG: hypothetical protein JSV49_10970 [Thermoplasmata archaeon]|nr:MAG: hypothetical protein JSV49_10970 [Thermoplasmata archaeon]